MRLVSYNTALIYQIISCYAIQLVEDSFQAPGSRWIHLLSVASTGSKISPASLSAVSAATQIGKPITALLAGTDGNAIASDVAKIPKYFKNEVVVSKSSKYDHYLAEELSPLIKEVLESSDYTHFIIPASAVGKSVLPRVGALMDIQPVSDILKVESENTFVRPIYAGNALATVKSNEKIVLASVRASAFPPVELSGDGSTPIEEYTQ